MALLSLQGVTLNLGGKTLLDTVDLHVEQGERVCLVGRNGVGKSSLMALLSGDLTPDGGTIVRTPGVTFGHMPQAVPDHWSGPVFGVVASGLGKEGEALAAAHLIATGREDQLSAAKLALARNLLQTGEGWERHGDILEAINQLGLDPEADFATLSGGNKRRVALARALAIEPSVLLMDEPLSNLDAKLRVEMREVIKEIQNKLGITTVYVTHDQEEAMAVSDRIAVMNQGVIQQIGTPRNLYQRPSNLFVATFIGRTNVLKVEASLKADGQRGITFSDGYYVTMDSMVRGVEDKTPLTVSIRPEEFEIVPEDQEGIGATVESSTVLGLNTHYFVNLDSGERVEIIQESRIDDILDKGSRIRLQVKKEKINLFTEDGSKSLMR